MHCNSGNIKTCCKQCSPTMTRLTSSLSLLQLAYLQQDEHRLLLPLGVLASSTSDVVLTHSLLTNAMHEEHSQISLAMHPLFIE